MMSQERSNHLDRSINALQITVQVVKTHACGKRAVINITILGELEGNTVVRVSVCFVHGQECWDSSELGEWLRFYSCMQNSGHMSFA